VAGHQLVLASSGPGPVSSGPILGLGVGSFTSEPTARTITAQGSTLTLSQTMAQGFDEAFARPIGRADSSFQTGEVLGTVSYTAVGE
ncbi:MAG TPA: hypothetical protein VMH33_01685, partial [Solirubrobacterales bacterium]|nr:hypothetical protein [Solirubrobacterales bacterium]